MLSHHPPTTSCRLLPLFPLNVQLLTTWLVWCKKKYFHCIRFVPAPKLLLENVSFFTNWRVSFKQIYFRNSSYVLNGNIAVGEILSMLKLTVKRYVLASWSTFKFRVWLGHSENLHLFSLSEAGLVRVSSDRCHCLTTNECLSVRSQTDSTFNLWEILLESRPALHTLKRWDRKKPRCT